MADPTISTSTISPDELADRIGKSGDYWTKAARAKRVPHRRLGRSIRFTEDDVTAILAAALVKPVAATPAADIAPGSASRRPGRAAR